MSSLLVVWPQRVHIYFVNLPRSIIVVGQAHPADRTPHYLYCPGGSLRYCTVPGTVPVNSTCARILVSSLISHREIMLADLRWGWLFSRYLSLSSRHGHRHHSPVIIPHLPFIIHPLPSTNNHSPPITHHPSSTIYYSSPVNHPSSFVSHGSWFIIHHP